MDIADRSGCPTFIRSSTPGFHLLSVTDGRASASTSMVEVEGAWAWMMGNSWKSSFSWGNTLGMDLIDIFHFLVVQQEQEQEAPARKLLWFFWRSLSSGPRSAVDGSIHDVVCDVVCLIAMNDLDLLDYVGRLTEIWYLTEYTSISKRRELTILDRNYIRGVRLKFVTIFGSKIWTTRHFGRDS